MKDQISKICKRIPLTGLVTRKLNWLVEQRLVNITKIQILLSITRDWKFWGAIVTQVISHRITNRYNIRICVLCRSEFHIVPFNRQGHTIARIRTTRLCLQSQTEISGSLAN